MEYTLRLSAVGAPTIDQPVCFADDASRIWCKYRDQHGVSGSTMKRDSGRITDAKGNLMATICYNGRVKLADGTFADGLTGAQWLERGRLSLEGIS